MTWQLLLVLCECISGVHCYGDNMQWHRWYYPHTSRTLSVFRDEGLKQNYFTKTLATEGCVSDLSMNLCFLVNILRTVYLNMCKALNCNN